MMKLKEVTFTQEFLKVLDKYIQFDIITLRKKELK